MLGRTDKAASREIAIVVTVGEGRGRGGYVEPVQLDEENNAERVHTEWCVIGGVGEFWREGSRLCANARMLRIAFSRFRPPSALSSSLLTFPLLCRSAGVTCPVLLSFGARSVSPHSSGTQWRIRFCGFSLYSHLPSSRQLCCISTPLSSPQLCNHTVPPL